MQGAKGEKQQMFLLSCKPKNHNNDHLVTDEADSETHNQTLGPAWRVMLRRGRRDCRIQGGSRILEENPQK